MLMRKKGFGKQSKKDIFFEAEVEGGKGKDSFCGCSIPTVFNINDGYF